MADTKIFVDYTDSCPRCGSSFITGGSAEFDGTVVSQDCTCDECGYAWSDVYTYAFSASNTLPESEENEVKKRVAEMSQWPLPLFPGPTEIDEITVFECGSRNGELTDAAFRVRGYGYRINFTEHTWARDTALDELDA